MENNRTLKNHLKTVTFPLHEWLEEFYLFDEIKSNNLSEENYKFLLVKLFSFLNSLESIIKSYKKEFKSNNLKDIEKRVKKLKWIKKDLISLDIHIDKVELNKNVQFNTLNSFSSVVGALYVLEGSTMGGMQIVKMINKNISNKLPTRYYQSYKEETMSMWLSFSKWLDEVDVDTYEVTLGASETFILLKKHLES